MIIRIFFARRVIAIKLATFTRLVEITYIVNLDIIREVFKKAKALLN